MSDIVVNVTNAGAANISVSSGSTINATVGSGGSVNVSTGTVSPGNATVLAGTVTINSTTTLAAGSNATVVNNGTAYAALLDFGIPAGPYSNITVGDTKTLSAGSNATVTATTSGQNVTLNFGVPTGTAGTNGTNGVNGANGITPAFAVGNVTTLSAGSSANVTLASSNGGADVVLSFGIPQGAAGANGTNITLSSATPSNLGTASAGVSNDASRADHVHALPVIAYSNLSGVPSNFPTNTTLVSGLNTSYAGINHSHNYVTGFNNLTGNITLAAGGNVTITPSGSTLTIAASGGAGGASLSDATPAALGTAAAGTSGEASRADHVHALPTIAYGNLSGVPANFPTNTTLVSGLQTALENRVLSVNGLQGAVTLAAGANITLAANGSAITIAAAGGGGGGSLSWSSVPASEDASGVAGSLAYDTAYLYVCVATDAWARIPYPLWDGTSVDGAITTQGGEPILTEAGEPILF